MNDFSLNDFSLSELGSSVRGETSRIRILPDGVVDQIAAGEVVERPASVVKELLDNALDAGAGRIEIILEGAGRERIAVVDDGCGMMREEALLAFERHATSKIERAEDLARVSTLGFRGEALPSIAAVSRLVMETAHHGDREGTRVRFEGGTVIAVEPVARAQGTTVEVRGLFYNTPARRAFLKSDSTEQAAIVQRLLEQVLARIDVAWRATHARREILSLAPAPDLGTRVASLWGAAYADTLVPLASVADGMSVRGFVQRPAAAGASRRRQMAFVNGRPVDAPDLLRAAIRGYRSTLAPAARPDLFVFLELDPAAVDVNVHPAKREVRFRDPAAVAALVEGATRATLGATDRTLASGGRGTRTYETPAGARRVADASRAASGRAAEAPPVTPREQLGLFFAGRRGTPAEAVPATELPDQVKPSIWQLHHRFILVETARGLAIVDQHSAHERVLYEEVIDDLRRGARPGQRLLFPIVLDLTPGQRATWETYRAILERLGFEVEPFGGHAIAVSAAPAFRHAFDPEAALAGLLEDLGAPGSGSADMNQHERVARLFACKAAIKAGAPLAPEEMAELVDRLFATRLPYDDVHGRPAVLQVPIADLERHFGRH
ncbi:MAG: DNA mismatch repair endonuclease MutL [Gemmatimonadota bacterium]